MGIARCLPFPLRRSLAVPGTVPTYLTDIGICNRICCLASSDYLVDVLSNLVSIVDRCGSAKAYGYYLAHPTPGANHCSSTDGNGTWPYEVGRRAARQSPR